MSQPAKIAFIVVGVVVLYLLYVYYKGTQVVYRYCNKNKACYRYPIFPPANYGPVYDPSKDPTKVPNIYCILATKKTTR